MNILIVGATARLVSDYLRTAVAAGHTLALIGREESKLRALEASLASVRNEEQVIKLMPVDSSSEAAVADAIASLRAEWGTIDSMVVAIGDVGGDPQKFPLGTRPAQIAIDGLRAGMEVNLWSPLYWLKYGLEWMVDMPHLCRVTIFGSASEEERLSVVMSYPAGKVALTAMATTLAIGVADLRLAAGLPPILVNFIVPGWYITPLNAATMVPARREAVLARTLLGRFGEPEDLTPGVRYLSEQVVFEQLVRLRVDGGVGGFSGIHLRPREQGKA